LGGLLICFFFLLCGFLCFVFFLAMLHVRRRSLSSPVHDAHVAECVHWVRESIAVDDVGHVDLCVFGVFVPRQPWWSLDGLALALHFRRHRERLQSVPHVQIVRRQRLENERPPVGLSVARGGVLGQFWFEFIGVGQVKK
jgi:hypothetical protein